MVTNATAQSGDFTALANTNAYVRNMDETTTTPIGMSFSLSNAVTFQVNPGFVLDVTRIYAGTGGACPPAPLGTCTPFVPVLASPTDPAALSIYNLTNTANGSDLSFSVSGFARRLSSNELSPFNGTFTAFFTNTPGTTNADVAHILALWATGAPITTSYGASFVVTGPTKGNVPEPASILLLVAGLAGLRLRRRPE